MEFNKTSVDNDDYNCNTTTRREMRHDLGDENEARLGGELEDILPKQNRQSTVAPLRPEKAIPILEELIATAPALRDEPWASPQREEWTRTAESALIASLGDVNPVVDAFSAAQSSYISPSDGPRELLNLANRQLGDSLAAIRSGINQLRWQLPDRNQVFLPAGSQHDAYLEIKRIIEMATLDIVVVDSYVDGTLWALLTSLKSTVQIRILTMQMQNDFALEARKFSSQHGNSVEVRKVGTYHDRFVLIDGQTVWHLGASIKDAGNKTFAMSELKTQAIRQSAIADVEATWKVAAVVTI